MKTENQTADPVPVCEWSWECVHSRAMIPTGETEIRESTGEESPVWAQIVHRRLFLVAENLPSFASTSSLVRVVATTRNKVMRYTACERKRLRKPWTLDSYLSPLWTRVVFPGRRAEEPMTLHDCREFLCDLMGDRMGVAAFNALASGPITPASVAKILLARYGGDRE